MQVLNSIKQKLIDDIVTESVFSGCSGKTIAECFKKSGLNPEIAHLYIPNGFDDVFWHVINKINNELEEWAEGNLVNEKSITRKISMLIKKRIDISKEYKAFLRSSVSYYISKFGFLYLAKQLFKTSDKIWVLSNDKSTDISYYTKRLVLSKIYLKVLLFWFSDNSEDCTDTMNFVDRELSFVLSPSKTKKKIYEFFSGCIDSIRS